MSDEDSLSCRPLYRSRSLPQLHTLGSYSEPLRRGAGGGTRLVAAEVRQLLTLKQHYYPEGGWGWVVVVVGMLVQLLSHGLHVASGVLIGEAVRRFGGGVVTPAGEYTMGVEDPSVFSMSAAFHFILYFVLFKTWCLSLSGTTENFVKYTQQLNIGMYDGLGV
jgi:hypothetical protein